MKRPLGSGEEIVEHAQIAALSTVAGTGFAVTARGGGNGVAAVRGTYRMVRLIALSEPDTLLRHSMPDARVRKVNISIEPEWLEAGGLDTVTDRGSVLRFGRDHLATRSWQPSARLVTLAEQILRPPAYAPMLEHLYLESRAVEIAFEALAVLALDGPQPLCQALRTRDRRRLVQVREYLDDNLQQPLTLEVIARHAGMSVSALQRLFRAEYGQTVFEYVRARRLQSARDALEREGATVAQAAFVAGYANSSNFSTAFRRAFGTTPGALRA